MIKYFKELLSTLKSIDKSLKALADTTEYRNGRHSKRVIISEKFNPVKHDNT